VPWLRNVVMFHVTKLFFPRHPLPPVPISGLLTLRVPELVRSQVSLLVGAEGSNTTKFCSGLVHQNYVSIISEALPVRLLERHHGLSLLGMVLFVLIFCVLVLDPDVAQKVICIAVWVT
jgi:hypothetical protein